MNYLRNVGENNPINIKIKEEEKLKMKQKITKKRYKMEKGITLVALVVTIVVLLILAGVTINTILGDNGIITKAQQAKEATIKSNTISEIQTEILIAQMDGDITQVKLEEILSKYAEGGASGILKDGDGNITGIKVEGLAEAIPIEEIYNGTVGDAPTVPVTGITLDKTTAGLAVGDTLQLTATISPNNATDQTVAWSSSAEEVATVSDEGLVTAVSAGTATITVKANGGNNQTAVCTVTVLPPLEVGSTVTYSPSGTYNWQAKYYSSKASKTDVTLKSGKKASGEAEDFDITSWKVLSIDEATKKVELVPNAPTTGTVYLGEAQGYNNGVKLLNEACSSLYGNEENPAKRITARSINIEDIEKYMTDTAKSGIPNLTQPSSAYEVANSKYPAIYAQEKLAVIGTSDNGETGLDLSEQTTFIEITEGTSGVITPTEGIKPYRTYWFKSADDMSKAFKPIEEGNTDKGSYHSLIIPGGNATYWVASRCISTQSDGCLFEVRNMNSGWMDGASMYSSKVSSSSKSRALFPVVSLSSELISKDSTGYKVNLD